MARYKRNSGHRWIGLLGQEAHAADIWPIGFRPSESFKATYTLEARLQQLERMLRMLPDLQACAEWLVDVPHPTTYYHVGGAFNDCCDVWPHRYLVFRGQRLVFRSPFHCTGPGQYHVDVRDLGQFLDSI